MTVLPSMVGIYVGCNVHHPSFRVTLDTDPAKEDAWYLRRNLGDYSHATVDISRCKQSK